MADGTGTLNEISGALDALANQVVGMIGEDRSFMEIWGWNMPGINRHEFAEMLREPIQIIQSMGTERRDVSDTDLDLLRQYTARLNFLRDNTIPNLPGGNAFHAYLTTRSVIDGLTSILAKYAVPELDWKTIEDRKLLPASQVRRLKQVAIGITKLSEDSSGLSAKIREINGAHAAAEALPATMQDLAEAQKAFSEAGKIVETDKLSVAQAKTDAESALGAIRTLETQAQAKVANIDEAYSAATTLGLGKAFGDRAKALGLSTWGLVVLLAATLGVGAKISANRIEFVHDLMKRAMDTGKNVPMDLLWANVTLTVVSVAAPVWFAWVLTKQIGQRFRLAEDYGFKASVAKAYEGYRREAVNVDDEMAKRLLGLALDRIDEAPIRLVERENHGSPMQEMFGGWFGSKRQLPDTSSNGGNSA